MATNKQLGHPNRKDQQMDYDPSEPNEGAPLNRSERRVKWVYDELVDGGFTAEADQLRQVPALMHQAAEATDLSIQHLSSPPPHDPDV